MMETLHDLFKRTVPQHFGEPTSPAMHRFWNWLDESGYGALRIVGDAAVAVDLLAGERAVCAQCNNEMCLSAGGRPESRVSKSDKACRAERLKSILSACGIATHDEPVLAMDLEAGLERLLTSFRDHIELCPTRNDFAKGLRACGFIVPDDVEEIIDPLGLPGGGFKLGTKLYIKYPEGG